jgi:hypothetical protein
VTNLVGAAVATGHFVVDSHVKKVQHPTSGVVAAPLDDRRQFPSHPPSGDRVQAFLGDIIDDVEDAPASLVDIA